MVNRFSLLYMANSCRKDFDPFFDTINRSCGVESRAIKILGRIVKRTYSCGIEVVDLLTWSSKQESGGSKYEGRASRS